MIRAVRHRQRGAASVALTAFVAAWSFLAVAPCFASMPADSAMAEHEHAGDHGGECPHCATATVESCVDRNIPAEDVALTVKSHDVDPEAADIGLLAPVLEFRRVASHRISLAHSPPESFGPSAHIRFCCFRE